MQVRAELNLVCYSSYPEQTLLLTLIELTRKVDAITYLENGVF